MNTLLSAPLNTEVLWPSTKACDIPTTHHCTSIMTRIEWCQQNRMKARTEAESEGWCAEEEGLRDALLQKDGIDKYQYSSTSLRNRYELGLQDGQILLRLAFLEGVWQPAI